MYKDHLALFVLVTALPHAVLLAVSYAVTLGNPAVDAGAAGEGLSQNAGMSGTALALVSLSVFVEALRLSALTLAMALSALGPEPGVMHTYALLMRRGLVRPLGAYFAFTLLTTLGFMVPMPLIPLVGEALGLLLSMIFGTLAGGLFCVVLPMVMVEGRPVFPALRRTQALIRGELAKGMLAFSFFLLVAGFLPLLLLMLQMGDTPGDMGPLTPVLVMLLGSTVLPLGYGGIMALYFSLRAKEGATPEQLCKEMGLEASA